MPAQNPLTVRAAAIMATLTLPQWDALRYFTGWGTPVPRLSTKLALMNGDDPVLEDMNGSLRVTKIGYEIAFQSGLLAVYTSYAHELETKAQFERLSERRERLLLLLTQRTTLAIKGGDFPPCTTQDGEYIEKVYGRLFLRDGVIHLVQDGGLALVNQDTVRAWAFRYGVSLD